MNAMERYVVKQRLTSELMKTAGAMRDFVTKAIQARAAGKETAEQAVATNMQRKLVNTAVYNRMRRQALAKGNAPEAARWATAKRRDLADAAPDIAKWKELVGKNREARKNLLF
jgi:hypothetical protein